MHVRIYSTLLLLGLAFVSRAQNTASPYSIYGIGTIETSAFNRTSGLGSTGIAYRSENNIIQNNPASYTDLIQQMFHVEASARWQFSNYTGAIFSNNASTNTGTTGSSQVSNDFTITRIAFATKVTKWWGSSAGIMPFTRVNYNFNSTETLGNGIPASVTYTGSGGINKAYWGNGFALGKHFSLGFTGSFLFGPLQYQDVTLASAANADVTSDRNLYLRNVNFDFGGQFYTQFGHNKQWGLVLGATYTPQQRLYAEDSLTVSTSATSVINSALLDRNFLNIPQGYGGGFAISKSSTMKKITFTAEARRELWNSVGLTGTGYSINNSDRYSAGLEVAKNANIFNTSVEHKYFQFGGYYQKTYLTLYGSPVLEWGGTIGLGINPLRYSQWGYVISLEGGQTSNYQAGAIKENFFRLNLTIHYWDRWFTRGRKIL